MDLLDDIFADGASKTVKAGGKFQPRPKPRLAKKGPAVASPAVSLTSKPTGDTVATDSSEAFTTAKNSQNYDEMSAEPSLEHPLAAETLGPSVGSSLDASTVMTDNNEDWKSCFEKSEGENADVYIGLDSFDDLLPHSSGIESSSPATDPSPVHVAGAEKREEQEQLSIPVSSVDDSAPSASNLQSDEAAAAQDPLTFQGTVLPVSGSCQMEMDTYPSLEADILGVTTIPGQSRRFQSKSKLQVYRERYDTSIPDSDVGQSVSCQPDLHSVHSEMDFVDNGKEHGFPADDVLDFSAGGFDNNIMTESAHEFPVHEEYVAEASLPDAGILPKHPEATSQMPEELVPQRPKTKKRKIPASDLSAISEENGDSRSLRSRRKSVNANKLVDEPEEVIDDGEYVPEHPNDVINGNDDNDEDLLVENDSKGKKGQKKSKKTVTKEGKRVRKSEKTAEASDQAANKKPKKFSHSTRQKRRRVDKALLEAPEGGFDYSKVPIKDLIILAEHKERLAKKDAAASQIPTTDPSAGASVSNYDEDETYASDEDGETNDHHKSPTAEDTSAYFNYQTYMDKTPSTRWSKQDTELFYEAVQQFGTDLSLIQQLFPGRTRRQLKLKYKKEEKQNPLGLHDALTNRSKDHSHFERVIEHLKQIEAEELQYADKDESVDLIGEEELEETQEINEEEAKSEHVEEKEAEAVEQDVPEMESPVKEDDIEDDFLKWSEYKSEV
ncbi:transcription factor TFIIIB component B'' [Lycium barbarum]|uniref:transcription factor TFIIIB component B'' n=1 Tax=Lycium barbarum TaxID=112863 RepID=UPI00293EC4BE|nr:transcription factor TFIIIB component B'' [Lycium barbarum]XP_060192328.1 transcription factor TFIIIB component B'' [Lycium barbarum]